MLKYPERVATCRCRREHIRAHVLIAICLFACVHRTSKSFTEDSVVDLSFKRYKIQPLSPDASGFCWFHSQRPHHQDRSIFKRLGGTVEESKCVPGPVHGAAYTSEAEICPCTAPSENAFDKHFLEIGSADGQYLSNLLFFELQLGWRGICVEGSPISFSKLKVNRPRCKTVNAIIGPTREQHTFYTFDSPRSWEIGMSCMRGGSCGNNDKDAQEYADKNNLILHKHLVSMRTLSSIFKDNNMHEFGWIMVDVEGAEDVVVPTIDLHAIKADFISYEGKHATAHNHLVSGGYKHDFEIGPDSFYTRIE